MHSKQIQAELSHLMETLHEQFHAINEQEGKIPRIEIDLMMSTLRNLYEQVHQLGKLQEKENLTTISSSPSDSSQMSLSNFSMADTPVIIEKQQVTSLSTATAEPAPMESISFERKEEITIESVKEPSSNQVAPLFTPVFEIFEKAEQPETNIAVVQKEEQPIITKTEKVTVTTTRKPVQTAGLFDEVTTVAESYSVKTTLHDKMSTGRNDRSVADNLQNKPLTDLKKSIGINEKFVFVKELFEGDHQLFNNSIEKLNSFAAYEQARRHLFEELAGQMNWNMESKAFHELSDLVKRRFNN